MITGNQIRIARFAVRWSVQQLSDQTGVPARTIKRIEGSNVVPQSSAATLKALKDFLEAAGIEFIGSPDDRPGIRIGKPPAR